MKKDYFHVKEVEAQELLQVLLGHFSEAKGVEARTYQFQKRDAHHFLEVTCDETGNIKTIAPSKGFPSDELDTIETKIQTTLLTKHGTKIAQFIGFCDEPITGYFRHKDLFQILPLPDDAPRPNVAVADHPYILEVAYESCPEAMVDTPRRRKQAIIYTRLLNLFANQQISLGTRYGQFAWTQRTEGISNWTIEWAPLGYFYTGLKGTVDEFTPVNNFHPIERVFFQTYYGASLGRTTGPFKLPDNLEQSLEKAFALDGDNARKFFMACSWYAQYHYTWRESHSSAFIALVTALECLSQEKEVCHACNQPLLENEGDICQSCGQPRYRVTKHFQDFLRKYFPYIDKFPKEKRAFYQVRSQLAHGMDLLQADLEPWKYTLNARIQEQESLQRSLYYIVGIAIYNWLHTIPTL